MLIARGVVGGQLTNLMDALRGQVLGGVCVNETDSDPSRVGSVSINRNLGDVQASATSTSGKLTRELVGCAHTKRTKRPSERKGFYTDARYRAWEKANKKRQESWKQKTTGIVYKLTSPSGKSYIGISKHSLAHRLRIHAKKESACVAIKAAIKKYGIQNLRKEILHSGVPLADLPELEIKEIANHQTLAPCGYNLCKGGEFNCLDLASSRKKVADAKRLYWKNAGQEDRREANRKMMTEEAREKVAQTKLKKAHERLKVLLQDVPENDHHWIIEGFWKKRAVNAEKYARSKKQ